MGGLDGLAAGGASDAVVAPVAVPLDPSLTLSSLNHDDDDDDDDDDVDKTVALWNGPLCDSRSSFPRDRVRKPQREHPRNQRVSPARLSRGHDAAAAFSGPPS